MDALVELIQDAIAFLFLHPKSTTTLVILLGIVVAIAFYVNRHRDETGRVSFLDRAWSGVIGARLYRMEEGERKEVWLLPLWAGGRSLMMDVKIFLTQGDYGINAFWRPDGALDGGEVFAARAPGQESAHSLSRTARFSLARNAAVGFRLTASDGRLHIDSPDIAQPTAEGETAPLPLPLGDSSLARLARWLQKGTPPDLWRLPLHDPRVMEGVQNAAKTARRKLDGMMADKKRLEGQLDQAVQRLKAAKQGAKS